MDFPTKSLRSLTALIAAVIPICSIVMLMSANACRRNDNPAVNSTPVPRPTNQDIEHNPSPLLQLLSKSPIHWQQFTPTVVQYAKDSNKLLLVYAASNLEMSAVRVLNDISSDPQLADEINEQFVPVLVDVDSSREIAILATMLCAEINRQISFPFMLWLSPSGEPVTWLPVSPEATREANLSRIRHSQSLVLRMWNEDRDYMNFNSASDGKSRKMRAQQAAVKITSPSDQQAFYLSTLRDLNALYDDLSGNIDNLGSLFPTSMQEYFAQSAMSPALSSSARRRCLTCIKGNAGMLIQSAAIDLIDGGSYSSRVDSAWLVARSDRNGLMQAKVVFSLAQIAQALNDKAILQVAERVMQFQEKNFAIGKSFFSLTGPVTSMPDDANYWSTEELEKVLSAEEYIFLKSYCDLSAIGNVPTESDPKREYFRRNSLVPRHSLEETAKKLTLTPDQGSAIIESIREKLQPIRDKKTSADNPPPLVANANTTAQTVSAYAALYTASAQKNFQDKAIASMKAFREQFHSSAVIQNYAGSSPSASTDARGALVATAMQSALDLYDVTLQREWIDYAMSLCDFLVKDHLVEGRLEESPPSSRLINLPIIDLAMIFDKSTMGLMKQNIGRLWNLGCQVPDNLVNSCQLDQEGIHDAAMLHTDYLLGLLYQQFPVIVNIPDDASAEFKLAVTRLPLRVICRKSVPANGGKVSLTMADQPAQPVADPAELSKLLTPE
jgi:uncharacterized protein YyaL (SSP411 family)